MGYLVNEDTSFSRFEDASSLENRPMMLKDFLRDDCFHSMYPIKKPCKSTAIVSSKTNRPSIVLLRSRSKKAAATTISAIHKVVNVVRFFQFTSAKSPVSISRKLHKRSKVKNDVLGDVPEVKVKVKDILRWKSFRDMVEDNSTPFDFPSSPNRSTTTTTTTTVTSASCSKRSSWCESDFTAEELPLWGSENEGFWGKKSFLGQPPATKSNATFRNPWMDWSFEESEQQSPVSVFDDSPFREEEEPINSPYHPAGAKCILERMQERESVTQQKLFTRKRSFGGEIAKREEVNAVEEKAKKLLSHLEENGKNQANEGILLDFFMHEVSMIGKFDDVKFDCEILRIAKSWINGEFDECYEWEWEDKREVYVKDMEKGVWWNKYEQEQEEMSKELEVMLCDELLDELLADFSLNKIGL